MRTFTRGSKGQNLVELCDLRAQYYEEARDVDEDDEDEHNGGESDDEAEEEAEEGGDEDGEESVIRQCRWVGPKSSSAKRI